jgi:hypothetical protein
MHDERQRHSRPDRSLRRSVDRVEDVVAWMLITVALLGVVAAAMATVRSYGDGMRRVAVETRERTQVQAVLLEPAAYAHQVDDKGRAVKLRTVAVPARYTSPDGVERRGDARVQGPLPAGAAVPVWVDRSGMIVSAPVNGADVVADAAMDSVGLLALGAVVLGGIWAGVRAAVLRFNTVRWGREWEQVEPRWSGRTP